MSLSQKEMVKQAIEALEALKDCNLNPNDPSANALASYLYTAIPELSEHLSQLNTFLAIEKPDQADLTKAG